MCPLIRGSTVSCQSSCIILYLSCVGHANLAEVGHKIVDVRHLYVQGVNLRDSAQDGLGDEEHCVLDRGGVGASVGRASEHIQH